MSRIQAIFIVLFALFFFSFIERDRSQIVGKWVIYKVKSKRTGKVRIISKEEGLHFAEYIDNGKFKTYSVIKGDTISHLEGNWKITPSGKGIKKFNISDIPDNPMHIFSDHEITIISVNKEELVTKEYTDSEIGPDIVYFKRIK